LGELSKEEKQRIEHRLKQYPKLCARIKKNEARIQSMKTRIAKEEYSLSGVDLSLISGGQTNKVVRRQEEWVDDRLTEFPELMDLINETEQLKQQINEIDAVVEALRGRQREFVEFRYFKGLDVGEVCSEMCISQATMYNIREKALLNIHDLGL